MKSNRVLACLFSTAAILTGAGGLVHAETPADTLIVVDVQAPNMLDINGAGANDAVPLVTNNCYDRLVTWGTKKTQSGVESFDSKVLQPQLAEKWETSADGKSITFHLRPGATFHSGNPVTAEDVKWTFDRVLSVDSWTKVLFAAGGITRTDQIAIVDPMTVRIDLPMPGRMAVPALGTPVASVIDSKEAKENASDSDPWALQYLSKNCAGSGPYIVESFDSSEQIEFRRFDGWKAGPLPALERVIYRRIESDSTRRSLIESGDADVALALSRKDVADLTTNQDIVINGTSAVSSTWSVDLDTQTAPFNDQKVRQAIAYAIPYGEIVKTAFHGRGVPLIGHKQGEPYAADYPVTYPYSYDLAKAKQLLAEAGYEKGFKTKLFYNQEHASFAQPMALLVQDSLRKINVDIEIVNIPGSSFFDELGKHQMSMVIKNFQSWLNYPEYYFLWNFDGKEYSIHNSSNYKNPALDKLIADAYAEPDQKAYEMTIRKMVETVVEDVPRIPVTPMFVDVATRKNVNGYVYWFHLMPEFARFSKAALQ